MLKEIKSTLSEFGMRTVVAGRCSWALFKAVMLLGRIPRNHPEQIESNLSKFINSPWVLKHFNPETREQFQKEDPLSEEMLKSFFANSGLSRIGSSKCKTSKEHATRIGKYLETFLKNSGIQNIPNSDSLPTFNQIEFATEYLETFFEHSNTANICTIKDDANKLRASLGKKYFGDYAALPALFSFSENLDRALTKKEHYRLTHNIYDYVLSQIHGGRIVFGQEAEDLFVGRLFPEDHIGFYLDIGAYHPVRFSNTYNLYKRGWRGINVEPFREGIEQFKRYRPDDVNVQTLINLTGEESVYYMFEEPALNTLDQNRKAHLEENTNYRAIGEETIPAMTIMALAEAYIAPEQTVDVMNLDIENMEHDVLSTINFDRLKPRVILVENRFFETEEKQRLDSILLPQGYENIISTTKTRVYAQSDVAEHAKL